MLPDLTTALHEMMFGPKPIRGKRIEANTKNGSRSLRPKAQSIHAISQVLKALHPLPNRR